MVVPRGVQSGNPAPTSSEKVKRSSWGYDEKGKTIGRRDREIKIRKQRKYQRLINNIKERDGTENNKKIN